MAGIAKRGRGYLPHWEAEAGTYFVTFCLADSLPQSALESIAFERKDILKRAEQQGRELTPVECRRLAELSSERVEQCLDVGEGRCYLSRPDIAEIVAEALRHFDGQHYRLLAWCVMPNHVHVVFQTLRGYDLAEVLHSWKSFTGKKANSVLGRTGEFWQREYFDRLVRNAEELDRAVRYVVENPKKVGLTPWKWAWARSAVLSGA
jgi:REP element-mobilizing transposase RayT